MHVCCRPLNNRRKSGMRRVPDARRREPYQIPNQVHYPRAGQGSHWLPNWEKDAYDHAAKSKENFQHTMHRVGASRGALRKARTLCHTEQQSQSTVSPFHASMHACMQTCVCSCCKFFLSLLFFLSSGLLFFPDLPSAALPFSSPHLASSTLLYKEVRRGPFARLPCIVLKPIKPASLFDIKVAKHMMLRDWTGIGLVSFINLGRRQTHIR